MTFKFKENLINNIFPRQELLKLYYLFSIMLSVAVLEVLGLASIAPFLGLVTDPDLVNKHSLIHYFYSNLGFSKPSYFIAFLGSLFLSTLLVTSALNIILSWRINSFVQNTTARLSQTLFRRYMFMPYTFYLDIHSSVISKNILNEVARAIELVVYPFLISLSKLCISVFITAIIIFVNPIIAVSCFATFSLYYLLVFRFLNRKVGVLGEAITEAISSRYKVISESVAGIKEIKLEGKEEEYISFFKKPSQSFATHIISNQLRATLPKIVIEIVSYGVITSIIIYLSITVPSAGKRVSLIALYGFAAYRLIPALHLAYEGFMQVRFNFSALVNLSTQLSEKHTKISAICDKTKIDFSKKLKLTDVSYRYPSAEVNAIENVSLEITPSSLVGIVGESGSGKSTLVDVILGLLEPYSGEISIGAEKLSAENLSVWRENISYVPQDNFLFDGSIEQNIAFEFSLENIEEERITKAIELALLTDFVRSLPNKEKTLIGERGVMLSGGQRQRVGIARAFYRKSKVIILDEATGAIDPINERKITQSFEILQGRPSIISITHRLSVLKSCDVIYSVKEGQIISSGSFDYLSKNCPYFRNLSNLS